MNNTIKRVLVSSSMALLLLLTGCASTAEIQEARALAQRALDAAQMAESKAAMADSHAKAAMDAAKQANACCAANKERMERAFERSMRK